MPDFETRKLTPFGARNNIAIQDAYMRLWQAIEPHVKDSIRYRELIITKLEEAAFFTKKANSMRSGHAE